MKKRILILCSILYLMTYLCRSNLSAVLDMCMAELSFDKAMAGSLVTAFFWAYAIGQIINGILADRFSPKNMAFIGIFLSACANLGVGFSRIYWLTLILWGFNGLSLSMIWPSIFKIISNWYTPEEFGHVAMMISLPPTVGSLISWGVLRLIGRYAGWRAAFFIPAVLVFVFVVFWYYLAKAKPAVSAGEEADITREKPSDSVIKLFFVSGLVFIAVGGFTKGIVLEGINLWTPTLVGELGGGLNPDILSLVSLLIPVIGAIGIFFTRFLLKKSNNTSFAPLFILFSAAAAVSVALWLLRTNLIVTALLLGILLTLFNGISPIVTTYIPLGFPDKKAQIAGLINFIIYMGASAGGILSGFFGDACGWSGVFLCWCAASALGFIAVICWRIFLTRSAGKPSSG